MCIRDSYLPDAFFNFTKAFIAAHDDSRPWLAVYAPPSCHSSSMQEAAYPARRHEGALAGVRHPRWMPNYNASARAKHWLMRQRRPLPKRTMARVMDTLHQRRLESLLAVDEHVGELLELVARNTRRRHLVAFSSDHGFALGEHRQPADKRQPYDHLLRIPLRVAWSGGAQAAATVDALALNVDLAATVVALATGGAPREGGGRSLLPLLEPPPPPARWRRDFLVSHRGEGPAPGETPCGLDACWCEIRNHSRVVRVDCNTFDGRRAVRRGHLLRSGALYYVDSANNTFDCVRTLDRGADDLYCEFDDDERFVEYYDHRADPWQVHNLAHGRRSEEHAVEATLRRRRQGLRELRSQELGPS